MIERCNAYKVGELTFPTLKHAQTHELLGLIESIQAKDNGELVAELIKHADKVIDILSTTATSKPRARRINGGTKKRKAKAANDGALADML